MVQLVLGLLIVSISIMSNFSKFPSDAQTRCLVRLPLERELCVLCMHAHVCVCVCACVRACVRACVCAFALSLNVNMRL